MLVTTKLLSRLLGLSKAGPAKIIAYSVHSSSLAYTVLIYFPCSAKSVPAIIVLHPPPRDL